MSKSKIEWTDVVWNPVTGCTKISPGCQNCYAERMSKRLAGRAGYPADNPFRVTLHPDRLGQPLYWKKPSRIFICSMGDLFHKNVPFEFIDEVLRIAAMRPKHTFIVLTKRPEQMKKYFFDIINNAPGIIDRLLSVSYFNDMRKGILRLRRGEYFENLWLGISAETQQTFDKRWAYLKQIPAAIYMISYEPALGPLILPPDFLALGNRAFMVCGGESGPGTRPMHPDWPRKVRDDCVAAGVPFFFKQWGEWLSPCQKGTESCWDRRLSYQNWKGILKNGETFPAFKNIKGPETAVPLVGRVGKKAAGRELDGKVWSQMPGRI